MGTQTSILLNNVRKRMAFKLIIFPCGVNRFMAALFTDPNGNRNEKKVIDARGNTVMEYKYGIHGEKAYTKSMDAGERWLLVTVDEQPLYTWDSRG
ncbi:MAG: hypothetical protein LBC84_06600, partial [Prevotellaceae bacterium]|nr:hypothetical protein [Prevotellaceae bacterium]